MTENPFFRNHWNSSRPRYSPTTRGIPVHQQRQPTRSSGLQSPKVVSIPIHFVGSEKKRSDAALKIQKVFRGFLVRKNVKKIVSIKREVEEIERKVLERETVELVRRDAKERLRMNEMLMALLFRLDSVRGVDSGVRECRKVVIRKAIALQEKLDAIVESEAEVDDDDEETNGDPGSGDEDLVDPSSKCESADEETDRQVIDIVRDSADHSDDCGTAEDAIDQSRSKDQERTVEASDEIPAMEVPVESSSDEITEKTNPDTETETNSETKRGEENSAEVESTMTAATQPPSIHCNNEETENVESSLERNSEDHVEETTEKEEEHEMEIEPQQKLIEGTGNEESDRGKGCKREDNTMLMEKMLKDNEKLMGLVSQLCERNAMQTHMISSLSQRVENLEKAFICEKLKRKKKKRNAGGTVEKQERTPDARKCGRTL